VRLKTEFNKKKKVAEDAYAGFMLQPSQNDEPEIQERDLHFGLFILGTEKHDSRRIDNQLRGRA
jgi:preprotein translocase subunit SecA